MIRAPQKRSGKNCAHDQESWGLLIRMYSYTYTYTYTHIYMYTEVRVRVCGHIESGSVQSKYMFYTMVSWLRHFLTTSLVGIQKLY